MHEEEAKNTINENFQNSSRNRFRRKNIRKAFFVSQISQIPLRAVWPDGSIIFEIFGHLQQWKFAQWHKPWSSLVEDCIDPNVKLFYDKPKKIQHMHVNIPYTFDCWDDPVVHLLLQKSSMQK